MEIISREKALIRKQPVGCFLNFFAVGGILQVGGDLCGRNRDMGPGPQFLVKTQPIKTQNVQVNGPVSVFIL